MLSSLQDRELYVITHEESLAPLRRRFQRIEEASRRATKGGRAEA